MGQAKNIVKRGSFGRSAAGAAPLSPTERRDGLRQGHGLGAGPLAGLQCAVPPRRRFGAGLLQCRLAGPLFTMRGTVNFAVPLRYRSGPLYNPVCVLQF